MICLTALLTLGSCGYRVGNLLEHRKVRLEILDNTTERRLHELDLSGAIAREMSGAGIAVNASDAAVRLTGRIVSFREPPVVETDQDRVLVGAVSIRLEITLENISEGKPLWTDARTESASFSTERFESPETAQREVFDRLARWVVQKLERDW